MAAHGALRLTLLACTLVLEPVSGGSDAHALFPVQVLAPSDLTSGFGWSVDLSGDYAVVGAPYDPANSGEQNGAVYVFRRQGPMWVEQAKLTVPELDLVFQPKLGWSVAIDGDVIVAGAPAWDFVLCDDRRPGAAYVFRRDDHGTPAEPGDDSWRQEAELALSDPVWNRGLGASVAVSGDVIVVGADCGEAAAVFRWNGSTWVPEATLRVLNPQGFGSAVDVDSSQIVVGAPRYNSRRGAVYFFVRNAETWVWDGSVTPQDASTLDDFGSSVSLSGGYAAVGSPHDDDFGLSSGSVYLVVRDGPQNWRELAKLAAFDAAANEEFGYSVAMDRDLVLGGRRADPWACTFLAGDTSWEPGPNLFGPGRDFGRATAIAGKFAAVTTHIYAVRDTNSLVDVAGLQNCFGETLGTCDGCLCERFDLTDDDQVDLDDFAELLATFVGP